MRLSILSVPVTPALLALSLGFMFGAGCKSSDSTDEPQGGAGSAHGGGTGTGGGAGSGAAGNSASGSTGLGGGSGSGGSNVSSGGSPAGGAENGGSSGAPSSGGAGGSSGAQGTGGNAGSGGSAGTPGSGGQGGSNGGAKATGGASGSAGSAGAATGGSAGSAQGGGGGQTAPTDQTTHGTKSAIPVGDTFEGIAGNGDPSDPSLGVGPNHIVQVVNWQLAVYSKKGAMYPMTGMSLRGPVASNSIFSGAGGRCEGQAGGGDAIDRGDMLVRYDQLAGRWVFIQPVLSSPYAMCYAVSDSADPLGTYHKYEFARSEFPDYPRLGVWPDGYYIATSAGDDVVKKRVCVADRAKMLAGQTATERCVGKDGVNFLNPADVDGPTPPPAGSPNILLALGGTQLQRTFEDDGVYVYKMKVDWSTSAAPTLTGPTKVSVARYHYLCDGQLTNCVPQSGTSQRLDAQGDKLMQRLSYRNFADHQSLVITHSVNGPAGGGGLRWYEFRVNAAGDLYLYQQSTLAPDTAYRWLGSAAMDGRGNIGVGYSFGSSSTFPGQRFVARAAADPLGVMAFHESVLIDGQAAQTGGLRWEDFATLCVDPGDDATFWYMGDYYKSGARSRSLRIGSFKVP